MCLERDFFERRRLCLSGYVEEVYGKGGTTRAEMQKEEPHQAGAEAGRRWMERRLVGAEEASMTRLCEWNTCFCATEFEFGSSFSFPCWWDTQNRRPGVLPRMELHTRSPNKYMWKGREKRRGRMGMGDGTHWEQGNEVSPPRPPTDQLSGQG